VLRTSAEADLQARFARVNFWLLLQAHGFG
jgi:hypothetical protein